MSLVPGSEVLTGRKNNRKPASFAGIGSSSPRLLLTSCRMYGDRSWRYRPQQNTHAHFPFVSSFACFVGTGIGTNQAQTCLYHWWCGVASVFPKVHDGCVARTGRNMGVRALTDSSIPPAMFQLFVLTSMHGTGVSDQIRLRWSAARGGAALLYVFRAHEGLRITQFASNSGNLP